MDTGPVWHPFTQHATEPNPPVITRTEGAYLFTKEGRRIVDAISSWWVVTHGHRHPAIVEAIKGAVDELDQVIFAGFTHPPAEELARRLVEITPSKLKHVFYSDSGSTAVEVALKMALGYWRNIGSPRNRVAVMAGSYHGDTIGTMSVGARGVFNQAYEPLMFGVETIPFPDRPQETLDALESLAREGLAALIIEPLILGAGGMRMYGADVLREMRAICDRYDVLLIADEVMTGWGRTGKMWACDHAGISPDIMCVSKGLTGGLVPLAATLASARIFDAHYSEDRSKTFFHSSSYTANPIMCAAALANLKVWDDEPVQERIDTLSVAQSTHLAAFAQDDRFSNPRQWGTIAAIDLNVDGAGYLAEDGPRMKAHFMANDLLIRPLGNTVYLMPPYCISGDDLAKCWAAIGAYQR